MQPQQPRVSRKLIFIGLGLLVVILLAGLGYQAMQNRQFGIANTTPKTSDITTTTPILTVNFNRVLSTKDFLVSSQPKIVTSYNVSGKTLRLVLISGLSNQTTYTITIDHIFDVDGHELQNKKLTFKPTASANPTSPQDTQVYIQRQTESVQNIQGDPLVQLLPFVGAGNSFYIDYTVESSNGTPYPVISITAPTADDQQSAIDWIKSQGIDPAKYKIVYKTQDVKL